MQSNSWIWVWLFTVVPLGAEPPSAVAVRQARVVTVSGPVVERGTVLVRGGVIEAVGENVAIPADAWVIEGQGLTVYPGLIDALSTAGIPEAEGASAPAGGRTPGRAARAATAPSAVVSRGPEDRPATTSWLRAADVFDPRDRRLADARSAGFTTAVIYPTTGLLAGQGAIVNLSDARRSRMVVVSSAGQYCSLASRLAGEFPNSLLGAIAYLRQVYLDAANYKLEKAAWESRAAGARRPDYDRALEGVIESPRVLLPAASEVELDRMLRVGAGLGVPVVIYGGHEAFRDPARIARAGTPILLNLKWPERSREADPDQPVRLRTLELWDQAPASAAALAKAGAKFAFYLGGTALRDIPKAVRRATEAGLAPMAAVRAFTLAAAEIYGVAGLLGSIEKGKIANLVITDGELFQEKTKVKYVFVDGVKYEPVPPAPQPAAARGGDE